MTGTTTRGFVAAVFVFFFFLGLQTVFVRWVPLTLTLRQTCLTALRCLDVFEAATCGAIGTGAAMLARAGAALGRYTARRPGQRATGSILGGMAVSPTPEGIPQRLAAIRAQMSLLADYL
jgi:hypothetical protein